MTCTCGHGDEAHRVGSCQAMVGGVPGFPSTRRQCDCAGFVSAASPGVQVGDEQQVRRASLAMVAERDFCDFPTGWAIQRAGLTHTDPRCSAEQTNGAMLCDCDALMNEWRRLRVEAGLPVTA